MSRPAPLTTEEAKQLRDLLTRADNAGQLSLGRIESGIWRATVNQQPIKVALFDTPDGDGVAEIALYHPRIKP